MPTDPKDQWEYSAGRLLKPETFDKRFFVTTPGQTSIVDVAREKYGLVPTDSILDVAYEKYGLVPKGGRPKTAAEKGILSSFGHAFARRAIGMVGALARSGARETRLLLADPEGMFDPISEWSEETLRANPQWETGKPEAILDTLTNPAAIADFIGEQLPFYMGAAGAGIAGGLAAGPRGATGAVVGFTAAVESDELYQDLRSSGIPDSDARTAANIHGVVAGLIESVQVSETLRLAGVNPRRFTLGVFRRAMARMPKGGSIAADVLLTSFREGGEEVLQGISRDMMQKYMTEGTWDALSQLGDEDFWNRRVQEGIAGFGAGLLLGGPAAAIGVMQKQEAQPELPPPELAGAEWRTEALPDIPEQVKAEVAAEPVVAPAEVQVKAPEPQVEAPDVQVAPIPAEAKPTVTQKAKAVREAKKTAHEVAKEAKKRVEAETGKPMILRDVTSHINEALKTLGLTRKDITIKWTNKASDISAVGNTITLPGVLRGDKRQLVRSVAHEAKHVQLTKTGEGFDLSAEAIETLARQAEDVAEQKLFGSLEAKKRVEAAPKKYLPSGLSEEATKFNTDADALEGYAWRLMGAKEFERLQAGEKVYGGKAAGKGNFLAPTPQSAAQYKAKGKVLVEFAGVEMAEGETVSNKVGLPNVTSAKRWTGTEWAAVTPAEVAERDVKAPAEGKRPWQLTRTEYYALRAKRKDTGIGVGYYAGDVHALAKRHEASVRAAVSRGQPVSLEVLEDYRGKAWAHAAIVALEAPAEVTKPEAEGKQPWEMTVKELDAAIGESSESRRASGIEPWMVTKQQAIDYWRLRNKKTKQNKTHLGGDPTKTRPVEFIHLRAIKDAVAEGKPVPRSVLQDYVGEKWADEALARKPAPAVTAPVTPTVTEQGELQEAYQEAEKTVEEVKAKPRKRFVSDDAMNTAAENIKKKLGSLHIGIDPTILKDMAVYGVGLVERGATEFAEWAAEMVRGLGEFVGPHLQDIWKHIQAGTVEQAHASIDRAMATGEVTSIKNAAVDQERAILGLGPATHGEAVEFQTEIDKAHADPDNPVKTRRLVAELLGRPRPLDAQEDAVLFVEQRRLTTDASKLRADYIQATEVGQQDRASTAARVLERVEKDLEDLGAAATLAGTKSAQGLAMRRVLVKGDYSLLTMTRKARMAQGGKELSEKQAAEIKELHNQLAETNRQLGLRQSELDRREAKRKPTPRNRLFTRANKDAAVRRIREKLGRVSVGVDPTILADMTIVGGYYVEAGLRNFGMWSAKMISDLGESAKPHLRAVWDRVHEELDTARREKKEARLQRGIATYEERLAQGDFETRTRAPIIHDAKGRKLQYEYDRARSKFHEAVLRYRRKNMSLAGKALGAGAEVINTTRALVTSVDVSAVGRQGLFAALSHPIMTLKNFPPMLRAMLSEKRRHAVDYEILQRPNAALYKRAGLALTERGSSLAKMEEEYMSRWAQKIPWVAASERAFSTFLNRMRADLFDSLVASLGRNGGQDMTLNEAKALAFYVNCSTGRGSLGKHDSALVTLNTLFFAPRLLASRVQYITGAPLMRGTWRTRRLLAKEYAKFLIGVGTVYALSSMIGRPPEDDPRSSEFGKFRVGDTRIDPMGGLLQVLVFGTRLITGETKTGRGKIHPIRGDVPYGRDDAADVIWRFVRSKFAPAPSTVVNLLSGENVVGEPATATSQAAQLTIPFSVRDTYEAMISEGAGKGLALGMLAVLGVGLQTYTQKKSRKHK